MSEKAFIPNPIESGILLRDVRVFEVKKDLLIHENPVNGTKEYLFVKGDILEEKFDEPNFLVNVTREGMLTKYYIGLPWLNLNILTYKGNIPAEKSKYFDTIGLGKIIRERQRKLDSIAKANDKINQIEYFLNKI
jgi:hypothetical protein